MTGPVIGVSPTGRNDDYLESLRLAGAEPRLLGRVQLSPRFWTEVQGVLLTGGMDVDPRLYGEPPHHRYEPATGRDAFEIELVARAIERDVPVFGICRGVQVMNVAGGGTLIQHIPDAVPRALEHTVKAPAWAIAHDVAVARESRLWRALGANDDAGTRVGVNSRHHQAVKHVAPGFTAVASAPDGVIEAIERPGSRFCLGVQWHPENFWRTGEFEQLFKAFVQSCV